ncbi:MAG: CAP domain-containing protein [Sphingomonadaceae bacterium]
MPNPTASEQLMLEIINRMRMDPAGEYARLTDPAVLSQIQGAINFFGVDMSAFQSQMAVYSARAPYAWNDALASAAHDHSALMIAEDTQSHQLPGEAGLSTRFVAAGYNNWSNIGENIYAFSNTVIYGHAGFVIDWGYDDEDFDANDQRYTDWQTLGDGMQDPPGHRNSLMSTTFTEIGIDITEENNSGTQVGPLVITQDLGTRFNYQAQFVGVVIDDLDNDDFYDIGEGLGGVTVTLTGTSGTYTTSTWASGGWQIAVPAGTYDIEFSGGSLTGTIETTGVLGSVNVKIDVEAGDAVVSGPPPIEGGTGPDDLVGTDFDDTIYGYGGNDRLDGGLGIDMMYGGPGDDIYVLAQAGDQAIELPGEGLDTVYAYVNYTMGENIEILVMRGAATNVTGNDGFNRIYGSAAGDTIDALDGDDVIYSGAGADTIYAGIGNDRLDGGPGSDAMLGGLGNDIYVVSDAGDSIFEFAGEGTDSIYSYVNYTAPEDVENLILRGAARVGTGNAEANSLAGTTGDDTLTGLAGNDRLFGKSGNDTLLGGADNDRLYGDRGQDTQTGGTGLDQFFFRDVLDSSNQAAFADRITDFTQTEFDKIVLTDIDADETNGSATDEAFSFIASEAFTAPGQVRFEHVGGDTHVFGNTDADLFPEFAIVLTGTITLTSGDFIL